MRQFDLCFCTFFIVFPTEFPVHFFHFRSHSVRVLTAHHKTTHTHVRTCVSMRFKALFVCCVKRERKVSNFLDADFYPPSFILLEGPNNNRDGKDEDEPHFRSAERENKRHFTIFDPHVKHKMKVADSRHIWFFLNIVPSLGQG